MASTNQSPNNSTDFFRSLSQNKVSTPPPLKPAHRKLTGAIIGLIIGIVYAFFSQMINKLSLPGVPYFQFPFGFTVNLVTSLATGLVIGFFCSTPQSSSNGVVVGSLAIVLAVILQWWEVNRNNLTTIFQSPWQILWVFLIFILAIPIAMLVRFAIDIQLELSQEHFWAWKRVRAPLAILVLTAIVGSFATLPNHIIHDLIDMNNLIQSGLTTSNSADLPNDLRSIDSSSSFLNYANADYSLDQNATNRLIEDLTNAQTQSGDEALIAHFNGGGVLACVYRLPEIRLVCRNFPNAQSFTQYKSIP